jgi:short-subunit dehydrogenase
MMTASILITGASSGLGAALAEIYAAPGVTLFLGGRSHERLDSVAVLCRARGAEVRTEAVDVTDRAGTEAWVLACDAERPLTLVIANAGVSGGTGNKLGETAEQTRMIFEANLDGVMNTVLPIIPRMQARRSGQIALMSSQASFRGMPGAPAYCASKAAVRVWGEGMRGFLARDGVGVTVICPGFVETAMTAKNRFSMPFLMGAAQAAAIMKKGIDSNKARLAYPWQMSFVTWLLAALPPAWTDGLLARSPGK